MCVGAGAVGCYTFTSEKRYLFLKKSFFSFFLRFTLDSRIDSKLYFSPLCVLFACQREIKFYLFILGARIDQ